MAEGCRGVQVVVVVVYLQVLAGEPCYLMLPVLGAEPGLDPALAMEQEHLVTLEVL
jgi:hypothetical protein